MFGGSKKENRQEKRAFKKEGYSGAAAKRMSNEDQMSTVMEYGMGGKLPKYKNGGNLPTSKRKTKHRAKTTNGGYGNGM